MEFELDLQDAGLELESIVKSRTKVSTAIRARTVGGHLPRNIQKLPALHREHDEMNLNFKIPVKEQRMRFGFLKAWFPNRVTQRHVMIVCPLTVQRFDSTGRLLHSSPRVELPVSGLAFASQPPSCS